MIVTIYGVINYKRLTRLWFNLNFEFQICSLLARIIPAEYLSELRTVWAATPQKFESECSPPVGWLVSRTDGSVPESALLPLATWWNLTHHQHLPVLGYGSRALRPTVLVKTMPVMLVRAAPFSQSCVSVEMVLTQTFIRPWQPGWRLPVTLPFEWRLSGKPSSAQWRPCSLRPSRIETQLFSQASWGRRRPGQGCCERVPSWDIPLCHFPSLPFSISKHSCTKSGHIVVLTVDLTLSSWERIRSEDKASFHHSLEQHARGRLARERLCMLWEF